MSSVRQALFSGALLCVAVARPAQSPAVPPQPLPAGTRGNFFGPSPAEFFAHQAEDDAEARTEWVLRQRLYPFVELPPNAYGAAAAEYLKRQALTRQRDLARLANPPVMPAGPPTGPWAEVGPSPIIENGTATGLTFGNVAGRISAVALHPTDPNVVLIGSSRGGIWRTANATAAAPTWTPVGDRLPSLVTGDLQFAPSNGNVAYAATGDDDSFFWGAGVMKSTDGGLTWARVDNGTAANGIETGVVLAKLAVDSSNPNSVTVTGYLRRAPNGLNYYTYVFHSADGGSTWSRATIPSVAGFNQVASRSMAIESGCPLNLWLVNFYDKTLARSSDGGATWSAVATTGLPAFTGNSKLTAHHTGQCATTFPTLYASVQSGNGLAGSAAYAGVYVSTDGGATWALPGVAAGPSGGCLGQCGYDHELLVDPANPNYLYMLGRDIWSSTDGGATWTNRSAGFNDLNQYFGGNMHVDLHAVAIRGSGASATVYVAGDGGLWSYDVTANTFTNRNGNLAISEFMALAVRPDVAGQAVGGLQDNGSVLYGSAAGWTAKLGGDGGACGWMRTTAGAPNPFDSAFATYINNTGYKSADAGATWASMANNSSFSSEASEFYGPWIGTAGDNRVWHAAQSLWYCDFPAACTTLGWTRQGTTNLAALTASNYVSKLAIHNPSPGVSGPFYAANAYPRAFLQSADGVTWIDRTGTLPDRYISRIVLNPAAPATVWVTLQGFGTGHVWQSSDSGATWTDRSGDLPNVPVNGFLLDPFDPANTWYAATDTGVYATANAGVNWTVVGSNLPVMVVTDLVLGPNSLLYAATGGRSVWTITLPCALPPAVGNTLRTAKAGAGAQMNFSWTDLAGPTGYTVFENATAAGIFTTQTGSVASGTPGLTVATPPGAFFRVAAVNGCGTGPQ